MQLFVDMDGVLVDFEGHHGAVFGVRSDKLADNVDRAAVRAVKDFYLNIPPMPDLAQLWGRIEARLHVYNPNSSSAARFRGHSGE